MIQVVCHELTVVSSKHRCRRADLHGVCGLDSCRWERLFERILFQIFHNIFIFQKYAFIFYHDMAWISFN